MNPSNNVYCPSPSSEDNIQCCVESEKHHEIRAVDDYQSWGFDDLSSLGISDPFEGSDISLADNTNIFANSNLNLDDTSNYQIAQIPGDLPTDTPSADNSQAFQPSNMDTLPLVQDLQPEYEQYQPPSDKALKSGKKGVSYFNLDAFNEGMALNMGVGQDHNLEDAWKEQALHEPTFRDGPNGGPGVAAGKIDLGWNTEFSGPQMIYDFQH